MRGLPARLFGPTVRFVYWNSDFYLRAVLAAIYRWESSCVRGWTGRLGSWRTSGNHLNYSIIENGQNTEKSPGDLRRLAVTQTPVKDHQLMLMGKTLMSK